MIKIYICLFVATYIGIIELGLHKIFCCVHLYFPILHLVLQEPKRNFCPPVLMNFEN
jgi:hypothetical protein